MVYSTFWSRACDSAISSGIDNLTAKSNVAFSLLVAAFVLPALISGWFCAKWWLLSDDAKAKVWRLYGHFTGIMCLASILGCVSWSSNLKSSVDYLPVMLLSNYSGDSASQDLEEIFIRAPAMRWRGAFHIFYSFEVMCVIIVKLMYGILYSPPASPSHHRISPSLSRHTTTFTLLSGSSTACLRLRPINTRAANGF